MPGIYGPPPPPKPSAEPVRSARPEHAAIKALRWTGTIVLLLAALWLWAHLELEHEWGDRNRELEQMQRRIEPINAMPRIDFSTPIAPIEPLQTADIIPASAIHPATRTAREAPPPLQTADLIVPR